MKRWGTISLILTGFFLLTAGYSHSESAKIAIINKTKPAVVLIKGYMEDGSTSQGSGFLVSKDSHVVTNWHVIDGATNIIVKTLDGAMYEVKEVVSSSKEKDLVKIKLDTTRKDFPYLKLSTGELQAGQEIIVVGNPLGLESSVSDGIVSAIRKVRGYGEIIQITAPISKGSSGSPVINMNGQVIGIATLAIVEGQNLNFALPASETLNLKVYNKTDKQRMPYYKNINYEVQLKDNNFIKVLTEGSIKNYYDETSGLNYKYLYVDLQFLKPCTATAYATEYWDDLFANNFKNELIDWKYEGVPGPERVMAIYRYKCDYRFKVFCTYYDEDGNEIDTVSEFVRADSKSEGDSGRNIYPGQKIKSFFSYPDIHERYPEIYKDKKTAKYWYVWVPK